MKVGKTTRVSVRSGGGQAEDQTNSVTGSDTYARAISDDGRFVVFRSDARDLVPHDTNGVTDVFRHDLKTGVTVRVSVGSRGQQGNDRSDIGWITSDGRYIFFTSLASNLVPHDSNGSEDFFRRDMKLGTTIRVSLGEGSTQLVRGIADVAVSRDGRIAVYCLSTTIRLAS